MLAILLFLGHGDEQLLSPTGRLLVGCSLEVVDECSLGTIQDNPYTWTPCSVETWRICALELTFAQEIGIQDARPSCNHLRQNTSATWARP